MASIEHTKPYRDDDGKPLRDKKTGRPLGDGEVYKVRYRKPNGRTTEKRVTGWTEARRFAESVETDKDRGDFVDPAARRKRFDAFAWEWYATTTKLAPTTRRGYWSMLKNHIIPYFGATPIVSIDWLEVEKFVAHVRGKVGPKKTIDVLSVLSLIMKAAIRSNVRKDNPALEHEVPGRKKKVRRQDMLTMEQIEAFVEALPLHYQPLGWTLVFTGYRPAEVCGANVGDLDFLRRRIEVTETVQPVPKFGDENTPGGVVPYQLVTGPTKTEAGDRSIPLPAWLCDLISRQLAQRTEQLGRALRPDEPLFVTMHGNRINRDTLREYTIRPALIRAGLPASFRTYDFRHNHASLLIDLGANVLQVAKRMGHIDPAVTLRVYGHLFADAQEQLTDKLDEHRTARRALATDDAEVVELGERRREAQ
ncbi:MAG TPA: site-specific integrase [Acidimicrobiales bacterium]|jgi:integrase|nr:site-specific integrase [Acidimicrobiales bacterium]